MTSGGKYKYKAEQWNMRPKYTLYRQNSVLLDAQFGLFCTC